MPFTIRPLGFADVEVVAGFAPDSWNSNLGELFRLHLGWPYFHAFVGEEDGRAAAIGHGLCHGDAVWLGNIIVPEEFRRRGYGLAITAHLVDYFRARGVRRLLLVATALGEPVYARLGFQVTGQYLFFRDAGAAEVVPDPRLRPLREADFPAVFQLDRDVTGEDRVPLVSRFFDGGLCFQDPTNGYLRGFCLPSFGKGFVAATDPEAGQALLSWRRAKVRGVVVIPEENRPALELLAASGAEPYLKAPRMALGGDLAWKPDSVWCRATGYCG